jgi:hypothetical protein
VKTKKWYAFGLRRLSDRAEAAFRDARNFYTAAESADSVLQNLKEERKQTSVRRGWQPIETLEAVEG